jgi:hypothetical protein
LLAGWLTTLLILFLSTTSFPPSLLRLLKLLRLGRIFKILTSKRVLSRLEARMAVDYKSLELSTNFLYLLILLHLLACGLFMIVQLEDEDPNLLTANDLVDADSWTKYTFGVFFSAQTLSE